MVVVNFLKDNQVVIPCMYQNKCHDLSCLKTSHTRHPTGESKNASTVCFCSLYPVQTVSNIAVMSVKGQDSSDSNLETKENQKER